MNAGKILTELAERRPADKALIFKELSFDYRSVSRMVDRYCHFFNNIGVEKGTKLAIYLPNMPEYIFAYLALFKMGAVAVPLDSRLRLEEVVILLSHAGCEYLLTQPSKHLSVREITALAPGLRDVILTGDTEEKAISLEKHLPATDQVFPVAEISDDDLAAIFYTSGTTGTPKGVMWTYRQLESPCATMNYYHYFIPEDIGLCAVPLSHNGGICAPLLMLEGIPMLLIDRLHPLDLLDGLVKHRITFTFLVPTHFSGLVNLKEFETADLSSLRWISLFGAPGGHELLSRFRKYCPGTLLVAGYGLTESAAPNVLMPLEKVKPGSVGKPVPWVEVRIVDEQGKEVPAGEVGEIIIKGWPITAGYYRQPELTAEVIKDGWLFTGDYGRFDEDGYLFIVGRKKDVIIVGGLNVLATEVEGILRQHPKVKEVAVVGVPDPVRGEAVKAVFVTRDGSEMTEFEVANFCRKHLARYKIPTIVETRPELPKTGTGKIKKEALK
ncbi:MAG TPA: AMP-binding protein [bacterium]|nr:AMP-binding protein [bacterium]HOL65842.1 AMP-binding protein [bacterium]HPP11108.1 AMP-binding protein [bacterium]